MAADPCAAILALQTELGLSVDWGAHAEVVSDIIARVGEAIDHETRARLVDHMAISRRLSGRASAGGEVDHG